MKAVRPAAGETIDHDDAPPSPEQSVHELEPKYSAPPVTYRKPQVDRICACLAPTGPLGSHVTKGG